MNRLFIDQMTMYRAYHRDWRNRASHFIGVPLIAFSLLLPLGLVQPATIAGAGITVAHLLALAVMIYWIVLDIPIGGATALAFVPLVVLAHIISGLGAEQAWLLFALTFAGGWVFQLLGHVFEGRKPALLDNVLQVFIAPVFLMAEVFFALGLRTQLRDRLERDPPAPGQVRG